MTQLLLILVVSILLQLIQIDHQLVAAVLIAHIVSRIVQVVVLVAPRHLDHLNARLVVVNFDDFERFDRLRHVGLAFDHIAFAATPRRSSKVKS